MGSTHLVAPYIQKRGRNTKKSCFEEHPSGGSTLYSVPQRQHHRVPEGVPPGSTCQVPRGREPGTSRGVTGYLKTWIGYLKFYGYFWPLWAKWPIPHPISTQNMWSGAKLIFQWRIPSYIILQRAFQNIPENVSQKWGFLKTRPNLHKLQFFCFQGISQPDGFLWILT